MVDRELAWTASAAETEAIGERVAVRLRPGDVVLISGELGAGKTTFARGICRGIGVTDRVSSPTFTIGQRYGGGQVPVSHLDLYRLDAISAEEPGMLEDYLTPDAIGLIEWPQAAEADLDGVVLRAELRHAGEDARELDLCWVAR